MHDRYTKPPREASLPCPRGHGTRLRLSVGILPSSTVLRDLDFIKIPCFLANGLVSFFLLTYPSD